MMCFTRGSGISLFVALLGAGGANSYAAIGAGSAPSPFPKMDLPKEEVVSPDKPVVLTADHIEYFQNDEIVVANGKVEVVQGDTMLLADKLTYDRVKNTARAIGNVSIMDQQGNVIFADEMQLENDLKTGVADHFKARQIDDSTFIAQSAVKVNENVTELSNAAYSPCRVKCAEPGEETHDPMWQLRADHVRIDEEKQRVIYHDATMEVFGVPVLYTPYMSHHTPGADNESGFMMPSYSHNGSLGNVYKIPFYYSIAQDKDITLTPVITALEGPLLIADYRQKFNNGEILVDGSITEPRARDSLGNIIPGNEMRGHIFAKGDFAFDADSNAGFDIKRTTDDTYLRRYDFSNETLLTSRLYGEIYDFIPGNDRNGILVEGLDFQGLNIEDNANFIPLVLPMATFNYESDPGAYNSRFFIDSNAMLLTRDVGAKSQRLANNVGMKLPYISSDGQMIELTAQMRGDIYNVQDVTLPNGERFDGTTGRLVPQFGLLWHTPFINQFERGSIMLEPVVNFAVSPNGGNPDKISNEDSQVPEFTDSNLFSNNRFSGYDRIETGPRVSYGMRGLANYKEAYLDGLFGQYYRVNGDPNFPLSNDLTSRFSDYVGKIGLQYAPISLNYRFRLDKDKLSPHRQEINVGYGAKRFSLGLDYLQLRNDPVLASREEIGGSASVQVAKHWTLITNAQQDLQLGQITSAGVGVVYKNECVSISNVINRTYTRDRDIEPTTSYLFQISLKNLN